MKTASFDDLVEKLRSIGVNASAEQRRTLEQAVSDACDLLDRAHAAYAVVGRVESSSELLAAVDARTRLLEASTGGRPSLHCDALKEADVDAYRMALAELASTVERALAARLGSAWLSAGSPDGSALSRQGAVPTTAAKPGAASSRVP